MPQSGKGTSFFPNLKRDDWIDVIYSTSSLDVLKPEFTRYYRNMYRCDAVFSRLMLRMVFFGDLILGSRLYFLKTLNPTVQQCVRESCTAIETVEHCFLICPALEEMWRSLWAPSSEFFSVAFDWRLLLFSKPSDLKLEWRQRHKTLLVLWRVHTAIVFHATWRLRTDIHFRETTVRTQAVLVAFFADDTVLFSKGKPQLEDQLQLLNCYCEGSGDRLQKLPPLRSLSPDETVRYLGIPFGNSDVSTSLATQLDKKLLTRLQLWQGRARTLLGCRLIVQALILSLLWYFTAKCDNPTSLSGSVARNCEPQRIHQTLSSLLSLRGFLLPVVHDVMLRLYFGDLIVGSRLYFLKSLNPTIQDLRPSCHSIETVEHCFFACPTMAPDMDSVDMFLSVVIDLAIDAFSAASYCFSCGLETSERHLLPSNTSSNAKYRHLQNSFKKHCQFIYHHTVELNCDRSTLEKLTRKLGFESTTNVIPERASNIWIPQV
ncbi:hypothetical protein P3T76_009876 [Phytophthora citrophthora]|uniref:Reverse transcriptase zinc-binding domain-containing protein n=1 Tax=Phytophthora citrophthora TaxID=4793 RepID=A0AAD9GER6_9STRA|nr:hypothetical protein P3T76_009876 [Phytophthora citrophthora]